MRFIARKLGQNTLKVRFMDKKLGLSTKNYVLQVWNQVYLRKLLFTSAN